jgi:hypothetical protein
MLCDIEEQPDFPSRMRTYFAGFKDPDEWDVSAPRLHPRSLKPFSQRIFSTMTALGKKAAGSSDRVLGEALHVVPR